MITQMQRCINNSKTTELAENYHTYARSQINTLGSPVRNSLKTLTNFKTLDNWYEFALVSTGT